MITANFRGLEYTGKNLIEVIWELSREFDLLFIGVTDPQYLDFCYKPHEFDTKEWDYNLFKIKWEQK